MDDKWHCRTLMLLNFDFLANLYTSTNATVGKILSGANDLQIKLVIKILYYIVKKEIPLTKQCMENAHYTFHRKWHFGSLFELRPAACFK